MYQREPSAVMIYTLITFLDLASSNYSITVGTAQAFSLARVYIRSFFVLEPRNAIIIR